MCFSWGRTLESSSRVGFGSHAHTPRYHRSSPGRPQWSAWSAASSARTRWGPALRRPSGARWAQGHARHSPKPPYLHTKMCKIDRGLVAHLSHRPRAWYQGWWRKRRGLAAAAGVWYCKSTKLWILTKHVFPIPKHCWQPATSRMQISVHPVCQGGVVSPHHNIPLQFEGGWGIFPFLLFVGWKLEFRIAWDRHVWILALCKALLLAPLFLAKKTGGSSTVSEP